MVASAAAFEAVEDSGLANAEFLSEHRNKHKSDWFIEINPMSYSDLADEHKEVWGTYD